MFESCIWAEHHLKHDSCLNTKAANPILFSEWLLVKIMAVLWFHRKVWWNCVALFRWAMCMTFPSPRAHQTMMSIRPQQKWHCTMFYSVCEMARTFKKKNKHFLVCHSHTPTQSVALLWAPSDNVTATVHLLNKAPCIRQDILRRNFQFTHWQLLVFFMLCFLNSTHQVLVSVCFLYYLFLLFTFFL